MKDLPRNMRVPRTAGKAHFYINPTNIEVYPNGLQLVRLSRRQLKQIIKVMGDYREKPKEPT